MKKIFFIFLFLFTFSNFISLSLSFENNSNHEIREGNADAKIKIYVYESLTCPHCAIFHKNIYPKLKKDFIDKGLVQVFFKNFPLDLAGLNAAKITHCLDKNTDRLAFLHLLFEHQNDWVKGNTIDEINNNLEKTLINDFGLKNFDFEKCLNLREVEDFILNNRIEAVNKYKINSTPTLVINEKKFDKSLDYKNLKKTLEKMI